MRGVRHTGRARWRRGTPRGARGTNVQWHGRVAGRAGGLCGLLHVGQRVVGAIAAPIPHDAGIALRQELAIEEAVVGRHGDLTLPDAERGDPLMASSSSTSRRGRAGHASSTVPSDRGSPAHMRHTPQENELTNNRGRLSSLSTGCPCWLPMHSECIGSRRTKGLASSETTSAMRQPVGREYHYFHGLKNRIHCQASENTICLQHLQHCCLPSCIMSLSKETYKSCRQRSRLVSRVRARHDSLRALRRVTPLGTVTRKQCHRAIRCTVSNLRLDRSSRGSDQHQSGVSTTSYGGQRVSINSTL